MKTKLDFEALHNAGIWILKPEYISDYLTVFPTPSAFSYVLDEVSYLSEQNQSVVKCAKRKATESVSQKGKRTRR